MARCVGIDVPRVFSGTFAVGCGLAAVAGFLGSPFLPLEPWYALEYLVPVLMIVAVGGHGSLKGSFYAALLLGIVDTFGRYYVPALGAFTIYLVVVVLLLWRPVWRVRAGSCVMDDAMHMRATTVRDAFSRHKLSWLDALPWVAVLVAYVVFPTYLPLGTQVMIAIIFALALDLALGYGGVASLGHAAFFGIGAYAAGLWALVRHVRADLGARRRRDRGRRGRADRRAARARAPAASRSSC